MPTANNQSQENIPRTINRGDDYGLRPSIEVGDTAYDAYRQKRLPYEDSGEEVTINTAEGKDHNKRFVVRLLLIIAAAFTVTILFSNFLFQTYEVDGMSMQPSLQPGDRLIVSKIGRSFTRLIGGDYIPERNEIIVFKPAPLRATQLIKRVIALPGDRVVVEGDRITVFNEEHPKGFDPDLEHELYSGAVDMSLDLTVPEGSVFVSGDNRHPGESFDSRTGLGMIPSERIAGRAIIRFIPFTELKRF